MNTNSITYDRSKRNWIYQPPTGDIQTFPAGPTGKQQATLARLKEEEPDLAHMLQHLIQTTDDKQIIKRALDGALYVADDLILLPALWDHNQVIARIAHPSKTIEYTIANTTDSLYSCSCPDWHKGHERDNMHPTDPNRPITGAPRLNGSGWFCKHAFAYHLHQATNKRRRDTNPNSEFLAEKLLQHLKDYTKPRNIAIHNLLNQTSALAFSEGHFHLSLDPKNPNTLPNKTRNYIEQTVSEATAGSIKLILH